MADTVKASNITDHPFMPRHGSPWVCGYIYNEDKPSFAHVLKQGSWKVLPPEIRMCRMAEAAHRETTVKR